MKHFTIQEDDAGRRVDRVLRHLLKKILNTSSINKKSNHSVSLSTIYSAIRKGEVRLNGKKVKPACLTAVNDVLSIQDELLLCTSISGRSKKDRYEHSQETVRLVKARRAKNSKHAHIDVLHKNDHLLFINKDLGIATHGANSIDEMIKKKFEGRKSLSFSVAALHRLDKNTTGTLTFSQSLQGARLFSQAMRDGHIDRYYLGINEGCVKNGRWRLSDSRLDDCCRKKKILGEEITDVLVIEYNKNENISLVLYKLITGKKHQIRKGATHFGCPLFCDTKYGSKRKDYCTYFLHAFALQFKQTLGFPHPMSIIAPIPKRFMKTIKKMFPKTKDVLDKIGEEVFLKNMECVWKSI